MYLKEYIEVLKDKLFGLLKSKTTTITCGTAAALYTFLFPTALVPMAGCILAGAGYNMVYGVMV
jgi:hypothetical protein